MSTDAERLQELEALMRGATLPGMEAVAGALHAVAAGDGDEAARLQAVVRAYGAMVDSTLALLAREQAKVERMMAATPETDPGRVTLGDIAFSFREQQEGLRALRAFLSSGDRAQLAEARERLARGAATAREAARRPGT